MQTRSVQLDKLRVRDFRCLASVDFAPGPRLNLVIGANASGKTSLLEALYLLGRGRSFRGTPPARLVRRGAPGFALGLQVQAPGRRKQRVGAVFQNGVLQFKLGDRAGAGLVDLAQALPIQAIDPNLHQLLEEGPQLRRRYLDWGVFHVEHRFFPAWRRYRRALRQRNGALRQRLGVADVVAWDAELVGSATIVDACRRGYVSALEKLLPTLLGETLGESNPELDYYPGWPRDQDLGGALLRGLSRDRHAGFTHAGPHRADLRVKVGAMRARDWVSRGQQKLLTATLLLAQAALLEQRRGIRPVLLIDDLAAELGADYRAALLALIDKLQCQCFLTFLDAELVPAQVREAAQSRLFHVEHGRVSALV